MLELAPALAGSTEPFVAATVVSVRGSAPRQPGASLVVTADGTMLGNVSGGCVDAEVYQACQEMLAGDGTPRLMRFGYSDADGLGAGLTCGGTIELLLRRYDLGAEPDLAAALAAAARDEPVAVSTVVRGPDVGRVIVAGVVADAADESGTLVERHEPAPRMLIFGAIDHAAALAQAGTFLGYRVTVCDARATFATAARFPHAAEVVVDWPHRYLAGQRVDARTAICVLTHDPRFDVPLLTAALRLPVAYVGAMGSRRTHTDRLARLRAAGLTDAELDRLHSPIGLDIGARTSPEIALSIAAEIVAQRRGGAGLPLRGGAGLPLRGGVPVHRLDHGVGIFDGQGTR
ncbi:MULTISPECIES: XdhC family protein [Catenuloplanes]|uniref:Xanthine dehydrogenase accessory factor n=1 Tax=Catenuloplanes niger TaxID=587534 RepID=A0AAE3ZUQ5_9ACTN|nr:XdhC family protein [Catenuloplanes niger]MDR7326433.1 xanthine dehydrogenase accessory factor [Catenuloplanes niger]